MTKTLKILLLAAFFGLVACGDADNSTEMGEIMGNIENITNAENIRNSRITSDVRVFTTTSDQQFMFAEMDSTTAVPTANLADVGEEITLNFDQQFQTIEGFGASMTDSSAYVMHQLSAEDMDRLMVELFSPTDGIGLSVLRQTIGASDFAREMYNYAPDHDTTLANFSIDYDREHIIPLLHRAMELNPQLMIMASPWSPPGWMKTTGSMIGGQLLPEYYEVYAEYFVKFIQEYAAAGITISAVTPQNEPLYVPGDYPGNFMDADIQANFINTALGPALRANFPNIRLFAYDHNWDNTEFALSVLRQAGEFVDGVAWHHYGGSPASQSVVWRAFPESEVHFTEGSGGEWLLPFSNSFFGFIDNTIGVLRNQGKTKILWNVALDQDNGPFIPAPERRSTVHGIARINTETGEYTYNLEYYVLSHFSKFIRPGAIRIFSNIGENLNNVAVVNEDGSTVVVVHNAATAQRNVKITLEDYSFSYVLLPQSATTFVFDTDLR
ncbi:MAG: hypothetical protein FWG68_11065 [Defluviitaleaceae bacterium]|nr:hypothetical protein [Defluviitaleaceae bacterium]